MSTLNPGTVDLLKNSPWQVLEEIHPPRWFYSAARICILFLIASPAVLVFVPWQQTVKGSGRVVALDPLDRPQRIEAPIQGYITEWYVLEGDHVEQGDKILEIRDNDPTLTERLEAQRAALQTKVDASEKVVDAYEENVSAFRESLGLAITAAELQVGMARDKLVAEEAGLEAEKAALTQAELQWARVKELEGKVLSTQDREIADRKLAEEKSKFLQSQAKVAAAKKDLDAKIADRTRYEVEGKAKIDSTRAQLEKAKGDVATAEKELQELQVKINRQLRQTVVAPRAGTILRFIAAQGGEQLKEGDGLLILVPDTRDKYHIVEMEVDGNDAPLVTKGRRVRLQFEGWPALQFPGWPAVQIGTFGGVVRLVDAADSGKGKFRVLVEPDTEDSSWPDARYLRQGVRTNGWVLLDEVTLGYEIWRQLNGFPPVVAEPTDDDKPPKVKRTK